ncbi:hypothetical protein PIB30_057331 [Stylosanthes scabra]|uniref:Uncharacterized protein n=1 Tax=Stylosanthes scabra TaxID=79078 RepID=A0ABU6SKJ4_9FABA|nr:hypothetical protein [Stylosanthes scabra]
MARTKQTGKRTRGDRDTPPAPPCISQMPVMDWFEEDDERVAYNERLSVMEVLVPKHLADNVLPEDKYPEFSRSIDIQGLRQFLFMREHDLVSLFGNFFECRYFSHFVAAAYTTLSLRDTLREDGTVEFQFRFKLGAGRGERSPPWASYGGKYSINRMTMDHHHLLYVLLPRKRNHEMASEEDLLILCAMAQGKQLNWPYLIAHKMLNHSHGKATTNLGHAILWTKIFENLGFDLSWEEAVMLRKANVITRKNINQMRRNLDGQANEEGDEGEEAADRDVQMEDTPPRFEDGTSSQVPLEAGVLSPVQPDFTELIRQGFEDMRTLISEGFTTLTNRMDRLDIRMTSQNVDVQDLRSEFHSFRDSFQRSGDQEQ